MTGKAQGFFILSCLILLGYGQHALMTGGTQVLGELAPAFAAMVWVLCSKRSTRWRLLVWGMACFGSLGGASGWLDHPPLVNRLLHASMATLLVLVVLSELPPAWQQWRGVVGVSALALGLGFGVEILQALSSDQPLMQLHSADSQADLCADAVGVLAGGGLWMLKVRPR